MPANLTPQYLAAEQLYKEAVTTQEKIKALEEMMAIIPKHKGTEKLRGGLKQKMAKLLSGKDKKHGVSKASALYSIQKDGAGMVALLGAPNVGKSSFLAAITHATPDIGDYPFTTRLPQPGMMPFADIHIQIVDMPPICGEYYRPWMGGIARQADFVLLVADLGSDDLLDQVEEVLRILEDSRVHLYGKVPREESDSVPQMAARPSLIIANKTDLPGAADNLQILEEFFHSEFEIHPVSALTREGIEPLRRIIFKELDVIRIYTKAPGKKLDPKAAPFVLKNGSTVIDAARAVHREFANSLKFARVWTSDNSKSGLKRNGQKVERAHKLEDGDILEIHI